jgi:UDP-glucuronate 4-epimerase
LLDLKSQLETVLGKRAVLEHLPAQPGDVYQTYADTSKAARLLRYHTSTPLAERLRRFAA